MKKRTLVDCYELKDLDEPIILKVGIGKKQNAVSTLWLDEKRIEDNFGTSEFIRSFEIDLGPANKLLDKELYLSTIVHDIADDTDITSVRVRIFGGKNDFETTIKSSVTSKGNVVKYAIYIEFIN